MNKTASITITVVLALGFGIIFFGQSQSTTSSLENNVEIRDGVQFVTINVKGGYSPKVSTAQADIPTKLVLKTNGTYDCSSSVVIRSIGYQKILPQTGLEVIELGAPKAGKLLGLCSMGMYNFVVNFK